MSDDSIDSQVMNYVVRMVVPMRREFGRQLDVGQFLHDLVYAREVLDQALRSKDDRLLEYARYVETQMYGPRAAAVSPAPKPAAAASAAKEATPAKAPAPSSPSKGQLTAEEMRAQIMKRYTD